MQYHQLGRLVSESPCERKDAGSNPAADMVDAARNTVSSWITHVIVSQPTHEERKAVLSCIVRVAHECWNLGNFNSAMEILMGLKSDKLKPFWLSLENEHLPTLDFLTVALLGLDPNSSSPGPHYLAALDRALKMQQCPVVPFFGAFLQQLNKILRSSPSLVVLTQDGHQLQFISDYCGEDSFFTRVGPGGLINMTKLYEAQQVVDQIAAFHHHYLARVKLLNNNFTNFANNNTFPNPGISGTSNYEFSQPGVGNTSTYQMWVPTSSGDQCITQPRQPPLGCQNYSYQKFGGNVYWAGLYTPCSGQGVAQQYSVPHVYTSSATDGYTSVNMMDDSSSTWRLGVEAGEDDVRDEHWCGDELESYQPVQPLANDHGVTLLPLARGNPTFNMHTLQILHHGSTLVHWDVETGRSCLVFIRLECSNGTLTWSRPPWSALKAAHSSSSSMTDFILSNNPEEGVSPGLTLMVRTCASLQINSLLSNGP
ncbi:Ras guanine-nucleotide exchange factors catalytic domain [Trinorchestia longiramus]|nr:Ras guanine-nucleotide exchange factors catalytic domain [Trinorchestia longiramus]